MQMTILLPNSKLVLKMEDLDRQSNPRESSIRLHSPSTVRQWLEALGFREVSPADICPPQFLEQLYQKYPDLRGDQTAIGPGDDGPCQSWRDHPGWWKEVLAKIR